MTSPNDGGCWFCHKDPVEEAMHFSVEFDAYFHWHCLLEALIKDKCNEEAQIIVDKFGITYEKDEGLTMTNQEKIQELHDLAKPLSDWLYENGCPHDTILIQQDHVEFLTGEMVSPFELRD